LQKDDELFMPCDVLTWFSRREKERTEKEGPAKSYPLAWWEKEGAPGAAAAEKKGKKKGGGGGPKIRTTST